MWMWCVAAFYLVPSAVRLDFRVPSVTRLACICGMNDLDGLAKIRPPLTPRFTWLQAVFKHLDPERIVLLLD